MRFNKLDLNLLVALDALLAERNISRAGERVNLSQPAMSNALARLREYFGDELLAAQGRQMVLTPRAVSLIDPVREVLMRIDSTITNPPVFDPAKATRKFVLLLSDFTTAVFVPAMLEALYKEARGIGIELRMLNDRPIDQLEQGDADLLIIPAQYVSPDHPSASLFEEQYLCVTWSGNSRIQEELTFNDYLECGHVVANYATGQQRAAFDSWFLDRFGIKRHCHCLGLHGRPALRLPVRDVEECGLPSGGIVPAFKHEASGLGHIVKRMAGHHESTAICI